MRKSICLSLEGCLYAVTDGGGHVVEKSGVPHARTHAHTRVRSDTEAAAWSSSCGIPTCNAVYYLLMSLKRALNNYATPIRIMICSWAEYNTQSIHMQGVCLGAPLHEKDPFNNAHVATVNYCMLMLLLLGCHHNPVCCTALWQSHNWSNCQASVHFIILLVAGSGLNSCCVLFANNVLNSAEQCKKTTYNVPFLGEEWSVFHGAPQLPTLMAILICIMDTAE